MLRQARHLWRRSRRRLAAALTLAAVAVTAVGVPLPATAPKVVKDLAERFPCENRPCGCADAASCWRQCCCHTNAEKLAWAKRNGVRPPAFVAAAAVAEMRRAKPQATGCAACRGGCCEKGAAAQVEGSRVVLLISALRCRGLSMGVTTMPPSLPMAAQTTEFIADVHFAAPIEAPSLYQPPAFDVATPPPDARG